MRDQPGAPTPDVRVFAYVWFTSSKEGGAAVLVRQSIDLSVQIPDVFGQPSFFGRSVSSEPFFLSRIGHLFVRTHAQRAKSFVQWNMAM